MASGVAWPLTDLSILVIGIIIKGSRFRQPRQLLHAIASPVPAAVIGTFRAVTGEAGEARETLTLARPAVTRPSVGALSGGVRRVATGGEIRPGNARGTGARGAVGGAVRRDVCGRAIAHVALTHTGALVAGAITATQL